jgi:hypothetical protein
MVNYSAFEKVSWVDPVDITITSLANNLSWNSDGSSYWSVQRRALRLRLRRLVEHRRRRLLGRLRRCRLHVHRGQCHRHVAQHRLRTRPRRHHGAGSVRGLRLRRFSANFYLNPYIYGYSNGTYSWGHGQSVSGGCSDLVHFRENHGGGSSS